MLWTRKKLYFCDKWKNKSSHQWTYFSSTISYVPMKSHLTTFSAIWDEGQGQMTSQESQRKPNFKSPWNRITHTNNYWTLWTHVWSQIFERNNQREAGIAEYVELAGTLGYTEDCGASQIKTIDSSGTFICTSSTTSLQHFSDNSKCSYKMHCKTFKMCLIKWYIHTHTP